MGTRRTSSSSIPSASRRPSKPRQGGRWRSRRLSRDTALPGRFGADHLAGQRHARQPGSVPVSKELFDLGFKSKQFTFSADNLSEAGRVFQGVSPSGDGTVLTASEQMPEGLPLTLAMERMEEFSLGLDTDLLALLQAIAELEMEDVAIIYGSATD